MTLLRIFIKAKHVKSGTTDIDIGSSDCSFYTVFTVSLQLCFFTTGDTGRTDTDKVSLQLCFFTTGDTGRTDTDKKYRQIDG